MEVLEGAEDRLGRGDCSGGLGEQPGLVSTEGLEASRAASVGSGL